MFIKRVLAFGLAGLTQIIASPAISDEITGFNRTKQQCSCKHGQLEEWQEWRDIVRRSLPVRGVIEDDNIHKACGKVFGLIYQAVRLDENTGDFIIQEDICPALTLTATIVCAQSNAIDLNRPERRGYIESMLQMAINVLDFAFHCLDDSDWPITTSEVLDNYLMMVEQPDEWAWSHVRPRWTTNYEGWETEEQRRSFIRFLIHWTKGTESEGEFWREKLDSNPAINTDEPSRQRLKHWLSTGHVHWEHDSICSFIDFRTDRVPRVLNSGSGPFSPLHVHCEFGGMNRRVRVQSTDGIARYYMKIYDDLNLDPLSMPMQCPVEELYRCFPKNYFDVAHMRNSLDHAFDPAEGIRQMLHVLRPGGWIVLRHARNEGVPGGFRYGLHQWAFDVADPADPDADCTDGREMGCADPHFIIWNEAMRRDMTQELKHIGKVHTRLMRHPEPTAPAHERYVYVEIQKLAFGDLSGKLDAGRGFEAVSEGVYV